MPSVEQILGFVEKERNEARRIAESLDLTRSVHALRYYQTRAVIYEEILNRIKKEYE
jgi:hypothetical protein